ncbi:MAG: Ig-like domain-containing protein [Candidatus Woesearchaeota archaeon]
MLTTNIAFGAVSINEFLPDPNLVYTNEWIELYNNDTSAVNVTGWTINDSTAMIVTISAETFIQPNGFLLFNVSNKLNNAGDDILLLDNSFNFVDNITYTSSPGNDLSLGRFHDGWPYFITFTTPTPNAANNRLPQGIIPTQTMNEDQSTMSLDLTTLIADADGDNITFSIAVENQSQVDCNINTNNLALTPANNYFGSATCTVRANDSIGTADFTFSIIINSINDLPVIAAVSDAEVVQSFDYSLLLNVSDVDNAQSALSITTAASTLPAGMIVDPTNPLRLLWTPGASQIGVHQLSVIVTDGIGNSAADNFTLTVIPVLQIKDVLVNGVSYTSLSQVNPGDQVTVNFKFRNNYNKTLGHISLFGNVYDNLTGLNIDSAFNSLPYQGLCSGSSCTNGQWVLQPGDEASHSFSFMVPYNIFGDFYLNLNVSDATINPAVTFADLFRINFTVVKAEAGIKITSANLSDSTLTCTKNSDLILTLVNTGQYAITPEILVYSQSATGATFNEQTGKFVFSSQPIISLDYTLGQILPGATLGVTFADLDLKNLNGPTTLYVYAVNPYFNKSGFYVGDWAIVDITAVGSCLKTAVLEQLLTTYQDSGQTINVNLTEKEVNGSYKYLNEDKDYLFTFAVVNQTHPEIINCNPVFTTCGPPLPTKNGINEVSLNITEGSSVIQENVKVTVTPTLEISNFKVNLLNVAEGGATSVLRPLEDYEVSFTLTNHLDMAVTDLVYHLVDTNNLDGYNFVFDQLNDSYINSHSSKSYTIKGKIPADVSTGTYAVAVETGGKYIKDDSQVKDAYGFLFNVSQVIEGTYITNLDWNNNKSQTYCDQGVGINVEYTNTGPHTEGDIFITVKDSTEAVNVSSAILSLASGQTATQLINFNTEKLAEGSYTVMVELSYNGGYSKDLKAVSITKHDCFNYPVITINEDETSKIVDLTNYTFGNDTVFYSLVSQSNSSLVQCSLSSAGLLSCGNLAQDATGTSLLNLTLTAGTTVNKENIVVNVVPANDAPVILLGDFIFMEDQYYEVNVSAAASDVDNDVNSLVFSENAQNISLQKTGGKIRFTAIQNWYGQETFNLTVSDGINSTTKQITATVTWNQTDDLATISAKNPVANQEMGVNKSLVMNVTVSNPDQMAVRVDWFVDDVLIVSGIDFFPFSSSSAGQHVVKAKLFWGTQELASAQWNVNVIDRPAELSLPNEIVFDEAEEGQNVEYNLTMQNTGTTAALSNIRVSSTAASNYNIKFYSGGSELGTFSLLAGESKQITVRSYIPADEQGGKNKIGDVVFSYDNRSKAAPLYLQVKSFLEISSIELNGKSSGKFKLGEENEIEVKVENNGNSDLEDVEIIVTIKDIDDGDDWDDDSGRFDLDAGDSEDKSFKLNVDKIDEEEYDVLVEVEVDGRLIISETKTFDVDLDKHDVVISQITFPASLTCSKNPTMYVEIENQGTSNEDEVMVSIRSDELGINVEKSGIELDKFSGSDNSYRVGFALDLNKAENGAYSFEVEIYRDEDKLEDSQTVSFTLGDCLTAYQSQGTTPTYTGSDSLTNQIQQQLQTGAGSTPVKTSFREKCSYLVFLGVLVGLAVIFLILGTFALFKRN